MINLRNKRTKIKWVIAGLVIILLSFPYQMVRPSPNPFEVLDGEYVPWDSFMSLPWRYSRALISRDKTKKDVEKSWIVDLDSHIGEIPVEVFLSSDYENRIREMIGEENIRSEFVSLVEGGDMGYNLYPDMDKTLGFVDLQNSFLVRIMANPDQESFSSNWVTRDGLRLGMSIQEFEILNGQKIPVTRLEYAPGSLLVESGSGLIKKGYVILFKLNEDLVIDETLPPIDILNKLKYESDASAWWIGFDIEK